MEDIKSSHELFIVLNENGSLYSDRNRDYRIYKTIDGLKMQKEKYPNKKIAVFTLTEVKEIDEVLSNR